MKYAVCFQQLVSLPNLLWISQSDYTQCWLVVGEGYVCKRAIFYSGLHASFCLTHTDG